MEIEDIVKSVSEMTTEQIEERLRVIRHDRTAYKEVSVNKRPTKTAKKKEDATIDMLGKLMAGMTPAQLEDMMKKLGG